MEGGSSTSPQGGKVKKEKPVKESIADTAKSEGKSPSGPKRVRNRPSRKKANKKDNVVTDNQEEIAQDSQQAKAAPNKPGKPKKNAQNKKTTKKKSNEQRYPGESNPKVKLKVVIRRLPPNLPEEIFWKSVSPWIRQPEISSQKKNVPSKTNQSQPNTIDSTATASIPSAEQAYFVPGKLKDGSRRGIQADSNASPHTFSRAYIRFQKIEDLIQFHRNFDGHLFKDAKGNEYFAVVEFAPFQKMQQDGIRRKKQDSIMGTIENDEDYKQFVKLLEQAEANATLEKGQGQAEKTDAQLMAHLTSLSSESQDAQKQAKSTPLLEHLRAQKAAKLEASKQSRKANHHSTTGSSPSMTKGKAKASTVMDPSIPTGPKAMVKQQKAKAEIEKKKMMNNKESQQTGNEKGRKIEQDLNKKPSKRERHRSGKGEGENSKKSTQPTKMAILKRVDMKDSTLAGTNDVNYPSNNNTVIGDKSKQAGISKNVPEHGNEKTIVELNDEAKRSSRGRRGRSKGGGGGGGKEGGAGGAGKVASGSGNGNKAVGVIE